MDNTIWDGVLLESSDVKLKPGIVDVIKTLDSRGILHSIASKNNYDDAMDKLKEFGIEDYFLYPEIHWSVKSSSIENIKNNINIGYDTILFIDDQIFEREQVKDVHKDVAVLDANEYLKLHVYSQLNPRFITKDSRKRRKMYQDDITRKIEEDNFNGPSDKFLSTLNMKFTISEAKEEDLKRAEELTIRTNQLNATGRTYNYDDLNQLRMSDNHKLIVCELIDKYGSYGKIGLALVEITENHWHLRMMLMSCRVMSRSVGSVLMSFVKYEAKKEDRKLLADFKQTDRNKMMYVTYKFANFKELSNDGNGNIVFENDLSMIQPYPQYIEVEIK